MYKTAIRREWLCFNASNRGKYEEELENTKKYTNGQMFEPNQFNLTLPCPVKPVFCSN